MDSTLTYLMCFNHVMAKVHQRLKEFPSSLSKRVVADIYDLHFAASKDVYDELVVSVLAKWSRDTRLLTFQNCFTSYQVVMRPRSTLWSSSSPRSSPGYITKLIKHRILAVRVLSRGCQRVFLPELGLSRVVAPVSAQIGANYARMELEVNPMVAGMWMYASSCYHFKFGICIHVIFALQIKYYTGLDGKRTLVNRSAPRKRHQPAKTRTRVPSGRPRHNGHTLSLD
ncbi:hypothetical protein PHMEG_00038553 [Phytophthora megakarya]|uniref:Uncharacterized protein n=1 Tax=Phytophthora megakarya TaxID=4795 RepID=A0A225UHN0_9STRA|nr:hypothetical protein PHMEG_00038553 [Phytophthora megakarya]